MFFTGGEGVNKKYKILLIIIPTPNSGKSPRWSKDANSTAYFSDFNTSLLVHSKLLDTTGALAIKLIALYKQAFSLDIP